MLNYSGGKKSFHRNFYDVKKLITYFKAPTQTTLPETQLMESGIHNS